MEKNSKLSLWKDVKSSEWEDWHWQIQNAISSKDILEQVVHLSDEERAGVEAATKYFKMRISPHIASLMDPNNPDDPLRKQFIPSKKELASINDVNLFEDVNADERYSPLKGLVHRYPTKALIFPSNYCGSYCRYCFRRKLVREVEETLSKQEIRNIVNYIKNHPAIEEIILSGGDPLVLSDSLIDNILMSLSSIEQIQILRIHTRLPITIPYRITPELVSILSKYKPIYVVIHTDTIAEFSNPMRTAISRLVDHGIPCLASCPLLKDINDNETALRSLWTELIKMRVKPYYLFHSDPVKGLRHFLVPMRRGLEIMRNLYDNMSGLAMPHYCFNVPDGGGHVLLNNNYVAEISDGKYLITTFEGNHIEYTENLKE